MEKMRFLYHFKTQYETVLAAIDDRGQDRTLAVERVGGGNYTVFTMLVLPADRPEEGELLVDGDGYIKRWMMSLN